VLLEAATRLEKARKVLKIDKGRDFRDAPFAFNSSKRMNLSLVTVEWQDIWKIYLRKNYSARHGRSVKPLPSLPAKSLLFRVDGFAK